MELSSLDNTGDVTDNRISTFDGNQTGTVVIMRTGVAVVSKSVLDAIREGDWYFEPEEVDGSQYGATKAIPGTREKLDVLAARARAGLPLWHDKDRPDYEEPRF